jgi:hypothetical protein
MVVSIDLERQIGVKRVEEARYACGMAKLEGAKAINH